MAKKKASGSGLMSSAGLMRYYEADETAIRIKPKTVVIIAVMAGILAIAIGFQYGTWPGPIPLVTAIFENPFPDARSSAAASSSRP